MKLTNDAQAKLDERIAVGRECIEVAAGDFPARAGVADDDLDTYAVDAVSNIITALLGPAGYMADDGEEAHTFELLEDEDAYAKAEDFLRRALAGWNGDAEDYTESDEPPAPRTVLVHVNVELPETAPATAADVENEIRAALEVAAEGGNAPALEGSAWCIPLAEEV